MNIVIFEDNSHDNFYPISLTKPLWELRSGMFSMRERFELFIEKNMNRKGRVFYFTREYLVPFYKEKYPHLKINDFSVFSDSDEILFINGTLYPQDFLLEIEKNNLYIIEDTPIAGRIDPSLLDKNSGSISEILMDSTGKGVNKNDYKKVEDSIGSVNFIWDLVALNNKWITSDFSLLNKKDVPPSNNSVTLIGDNSRLYIEDNVKIDPFVVVDVSNGPVYIKSGSEIHSFTRIEGPCYIGSGTVVLGGKLRGGCSIGDCCRVGGEVEESIFHGYSNKYHDGFIGHSYIGEWVNLGAMTTNSDLKNNYKDIKIYIPDGKVDTAMNKVGTFIGDFTKTSIGTLLNTGSSLGVGTMMVHDGGFAPAHVPSFAWFARSEVKDLSWFEDFLVTCGVVTSRRDIKFTEAYSSLLREIYNMTAELRKKEASKWSKPMK
ncbi:putative sugar nucleotidyl transferase [Spirochaetota bacterium]